MTDTGAGPEVSLDPMTERRFRAFKAHLVAHYARDKVEAGAWPAGEASRLAAADLDGLLPEGVETGGHLLFTVRDSATGEKVGTVWISFRAEGPGRRVWIYDLEVFERFRRRGYAARILEAVENRARELGAQKIGLHVFGHNAGARRLYERSGYGPTSVVMHKRLDGR